MFTRRHPLDPIITEHDRLEAEQRLRAPFVVRDPEIGAVLAEIQRASAILIRAERMVRDMEKGRTK